ncbi:MAG: hypothetical protein ACRC7O_12020 [Fimbriiglobus sp.]
MCARIVYLILAGMFVFLVTTVAAFRYLVWWQAILASAATFLLLIYAAKVLIRTAFGRLGDMAKGMFDAKSKVLHGATIQVHAVRPSSPPASLPQPPADGDDLDDADPDTLQEIAELHDRAWYDIEVTIFPAPADGPMEHWDLDDLRLAPADAPTPTFGSDGDDGDDFELYDAMVVTDGVPNPPDEAKFRGPQRVRFTVGVTKTVHEVQFRYYFEQFGRVPLIRQLPSR